MDIDDQGLDRYGRTIPEIIRDETALGDDLAGYAGQWVAVRRSKLVASAPTREQLVAQIDWDEVDTIFEVIEGPCFFAVA
jgi:hypothetical protein